MALTFMQIWSGALPIMLPLSGKWVGNTFGWPAIFWLQAIICGILCILVLLFVSETSELAGKGCLKPDPAALEDPEFFRVSTTLMFHVIAEAIAQIANHDSIGQFSASNIVDGTAKLAVSGGPAAALCCRDHRMTAVHQAPEHYLSYMEFQNMALARALFDGQVNAIAAVGLGQVRIGGMISQIDNINRILDRVAVYLG